MAPTLAAASAASAAGTTTTPPAGATLFVRSLDTSVDEPVLETLFAQLGPLRRCMLVRAKAATPLEASAPRPAPLPPSRGFAFVQYATPADAQRALVQLQGHSLRGRKIKLDYAIPRSRNPKDPKDPKDPPPPSPPAAQPPSVPSPARAAPPAGSTRITASPTITPPSDPVAASPTTTPSATAPARARHARVPRAPPPELSKAAAPSTTATAAAAGALALRTVLLRVRPGSESAPLTVRRARELASAAVSAHEEEPGTVRLVFATAIIARAALAELHVGDQVAELVAAAKSGKRARLIVRNWPFVATQDTLRSVFQAYGPVREATLPLSHPLNKPMGFGFVEYFLPQDAKAAVDRQNAKKVQGRVIAVDYALAKDLYNTLKPDHHKEQTQSNPIDKDSNESNSEHVPQTRSGKLPSSSPDQLNRTLFVRNLLYETSPEELRAAMEKYGTVEQAVLVLDTITKRPRGTAFVRMSTPEEAQALLATDHQNESGITLQGRPIYVCSALPKESARKITSVEQKKKDDKRNIWLASEGTVAPGSDAAAGLTDDDLKKRAKAEREKNEKLSKNPNTFISTTRLCVRNLPKPLTAKILKLLFTNACELPKKKVLRQAKVVRDDDRVTAGGVARSKGYGFVEFFDHAMALKALRSINNNPNAFDVYLPKEFKALERRRLIVEFAVEDSRKLLLLTKSQSFGKGPGDTPEQDSNSKVDQALKSKRKNDKDGRVMEGTPSKKARTAQLTKIGKDAGSTRLVKDRTNKTNAPEPKKKSSSAPEAAKKKRKGRSEADSATRPPRKPKNEEGGNFEKLVADYQKRLAAC